MIICSNDANFFNKKCVFYLFILYINRWRYDATNFQPIAGLGDEKFLSSFFSANKLCLIFNFVVEINPLTYITYTSKNLIKLIKKAKV